MRYKTDDTRRIMYSDTIHSHYLSAQISPMTFAHTNTHAANPVVLATHLYGAVFMVLCLSCCKTQNVDIICVCIHNSQGVYLCRFHRLEHGEIVCAIVI